MGGTPSGGTPSGGTPSGGAAMGGKPGGGAAGAVAGGVAGAMMMGAEAGEPGVGGDGMAEPMPGEPTAEGGADSGTGGRKTSVEAPDKAPARSSGCGCDVPGSSAPASQALWLALLGLVAQRARRRRAA